MKCSNTILFIFNLYIPWDCVLPKFTVAGSAKIFGIFVLAIRSSEKWIELDGNSEYKSIGVHLS